MVTKKQYPNHHIFETDIGGRTFTVETGKVAQLANGSALVRYGDTVVMVNVTMSAQPREGVDFFPLAVDFEEKQYSVGKIPGGFIKREGRPTEKATLTCRLIDRPLRPLFNEHIDSLLGVGPIPESGQGILAGFILHI